MVLRIITVDNSVRYNPEIEQSKEKDIKPDTIKNNSNRRKQNKNFSQTRKSFLKIFQHKDSNILKF